MIFGTVKAVVRVVTRNLYRKNNNIAQPVSATGRGAAFMCVRGKAAGRGRDVLRTGALIHSDPVALADWTVFHHMRDVRSLELELRPDKGES